jgi:hypothetical protein
MRVAAVQAGDGLMIEPATCMLLRMSRIIDMKRSLKDRTMIKVLIPVRSFIVKKNKNKYFTQINVTRTRS